MTNRFLIPALIIIIVISSCNNPDRRLNIVNNSNENIFYLISNEGRFSILENPILLLDDKVDLLNSDVILPNDSIQPPMRSNPEGWVQLINEGEDKKIHIFFFKKSIFDTLRWRQIVEKQICTQHVALDLNALNQVKWRIEYR